MGGCLIAYKGFDAYDNWLLNAAGVLAIAVALIPTTEPKEESVRGLVHMILAIAFFGSLTLVAVRPQAKALGQVSNQRAARSDRRINPWKARTKTEFNAWYKVTAAGMLLFPALAAIVVWQLGQHNFWVLALEVAALWTFSGYWALKNREMKLSGADVEAAKAAAKLEEPKDRGTFQRLRKSLQQLSLPRPTPQP